MGGGTELWIQRNRGLFIDNCSFLPVVLHSDQFGPFLEGGAKAT